MKIFDEEVVFKKYIVVPEIRVETSAGGGGDLTVADDLLVTDAAGIGGDLTVTGTISVTGTAYLVDVDVAGTLTYSTLSLSGDVSFDEVTANTAYFVDVQVTGNFTADASAGTFGVTADNITALCTTAYLSATDNIWSLAGYDQHVEASNVLVLDASTLNIGTETAFANEITIGKSADTAQNVTVYANVLNVDVVSAVGIDASAINIGTDTAYANAITIGDSTNTTQVVSVAVGGFVSVEAGWINIGQSGSYSNYVNIGAEANTTQAVAISGGNLQVRFASSVAADAPAINIGTDTAYDNAITIGNLTNTGVTVSVYGGDTLYAYGNSEVVIDGGSLMYIGTASATAISIGSTAVGSLNLDAGTSLTIDGVGISVGTDTTIVSTVSIGCVVATVGIDGTAVNIDAEAINIGTDTAYANAITIGDALSTTQAVSVYGGNILLTAADSTGTINGTALNFTFTAANSFTIDVAENFSAGGTSNYFRCTPGDGGMWIVGNSDILVSASNNITMTAEADMTLDASAINIGTDTSLANAVTIGAATDTTQTVSVYGGSILIDANDDGTVDIDGYTVTIGIPTHGLTVQPDEGYVIINSLDSVSASAAGSFSISAAIIDLDGSTSIDLDAGNGTALNIGTSAGLAQQITIGSSSGVSNVLNLYAKSLNVRGGADIYVTAVTGVQVFAPDGIRQRAGYNADSDDNEIDHLTLNGAHGMLIVVDETNAVNGIFRLEGDEVISISANAEFSIVKDTDTKINIYWEANDFHIQNCVDAGNMKITWAFYGVRLQP